MLNKYFLIATFALLVFGLSMPVTDYSAFPNLEGIRNAIDEVAQRVPAARSRMPEEFVDLRFLNELEREGFFQAFE